MLRIALLIVLLLCVPGSALGRQRPVEKKVKTIQMGIVVVSAMPEKVHPGLREVARVYRRPNTRIQKALFFQTRKDRPQVA